jgi:hypothetical protein
LLTLKPKFLRTILVHPPPVRVAPPAPSSMA